MQEQLEQLAAAKDELKLMRQQAAEAQQQSVAAAASKQELQTLLDEARQDIAKASTALTECTELRAKLKSAERKTQKYATVAAEATKNAEDWRNVVAGRDRKIAELEGSETAQALKGLLAEYQQLEQERDALKAAHAKQVAELQGAAKDALAESKKEIKKLQQSLTAEQNSRLRAAAAADKEIQSLQAANKVLHESAAKQEGAPPFSKTAIMSAVRDALTAIYRNPKEQRAKPIKLLQFRWHPDKFPDIPMLGELVLKEINQIIETWNNPPPPPAAGAPPPPANAPPPPPPPPPPGGA